MAMCSFYHPAQLQSNSEAVPNLPTAVFHYRTGMMHS